MFRTKKAWWGPVIFLIALFVPSEGFSVDRDPYSYKTLIGKIYLEYEKDTAEQSGITQQSSRFRQTYSLDFRGNVLSPRLIVFDSGLAFTDSNYSSDVTNYDTKYLDYYLRTTILPKSAIPLTLYGSKNDSDTTGDTSSGNTRTIYGLNWFARLSTLPTTYLAIEKANDSGKDTDTDTTTYRLDLKKNIGPTENSFDMNIADKSNQITGDKELSSTFNVRNNTKFSPSTSLYMGLARSSTNTNSATSSDSTVNGLSLVLTSRPSKEFSQNHSYTFFQNKTDGTQEGSSYNGEMDYIFSTRLKSHLGLQMQSTSDKTSTSSSQSDSVGANTSVSYAITNNLAVAESIVYSKYTTNASDVTVANVGDRTVFKVLTFLTYTKPLSWALLNTRYGLGYAEDQTIKNGGGKGIEQDISLGLTDIKINPIVGFNTLATYNENISLSGNMSSKTRAFHLDAFNRPGRQYISLLGSFDKSAESSFITLVETKSEIYKFTAGSDYFKNTKMKLTFDKSDIFNEVTGFTHSKSQEAYIDHASAVFGGNLTLALLWSITSTHSPGQAQRIVTLNYNLKFGRRLIGNIFWQLLIDRTQSKESENFSRVNTIENSLVIPLRSWLLSAEHRYQMTEDNLRDLKENRILFRATRTFIRVF